jgi:hypothetical protein
MGHADFYELKGPGIEITYRRSDGELTTMSDEFDSLSDGKFVADTAVQPEIGILATAVVLPSSRAGLRITLTLLLPEVDVEADSRASTEDATGVRAASRGRAASSCGDLQEDQRGEDRGTPPPRSG